MYAFPSPSLYPVPFGYWKARCVKEQLVAEVELSLHPEPGTQGCLRQLRNRHFHIAFHPICLISMRYPNVYSFAPALSSPVMSTWASPAQSNCQWGTCSSRWTVNETAVLCLSLEECLFPGPGLSPLSGSCFVYSLSEPLPFQCRLFHMTGRALKSPLRFTLEKFTQET